MTADDRKSPEWALLVEARRDGFIRNPIDVLVWGHQYHLRICDTLEHIADNLLDGVDRASCENAIKALRHDLLIHHRDENHGLFPILRRRSRRGDNVDGILDQLLMEHAADESYAIEVTECLSHLAAGAQPNNPNMIGYMLRGFFESYRRHLNWECKLVLPLARRRLGEEDVTELGQKMLNHRGWGQVVRLIPSRTHEKQCPCNCETGSCDLDTHEDIHAELDNVVMFPK